MKQLNAKNSQINQTICYRFDGNVIYIKYNDLSQAAQVMDNCKKQGAVIQIGKNWIKIELPESFILGKIEINAKIQKKEEMETQISHFFKEILEKGGFSVEIIEI